MKWFVAAFAFIAILANHAAAEDAKKPFTVDFTQILTGPDGKPLPGMDCKAEQGKPDPVPGQTCSALTLSDAAVVALEAVLEEDRSADPKKKFENDQLARKVYKQKSIVLLLDEVTKIKDRIGKAFGAAVVGAAWPILDPTLR